MCMYLVFVVAIDYEMFLQQNFPDLSCMYIVQCSLEESLIVSGDLWLWHQTLMLVL